MAVSSSFMLKGKRFTSYAAVSTTEVIESSSLLSKTLAQKAELIALSQALQLGQRDYT
jgi:hypothetical protein